MAVAILEGVHTYALAVWMLSGSKRKKSRGRLTRPKGERSGEEFKGLCHDCKDRLTCKAPKPVGGVWHCEEYR